ncbi:MAG: hypothetical protein GVY07_14605 [Bacteroidetes bacterium]|jgi:hypothetical protein|nr:hypothetical protein [Bacteroidota bacterium]
MKSIKVLPILFLVIGAFFLFLEETKAEDECGEQCNTICYATSPDACTNTLCWDGEEWVTITCYGDNKADPEEG